VYEFDLLLLDQRVFPSSISILPIDKNYLSTVRKR
jgi:hypothetical protein